MKANQIVSSITLTAATLGVSACGYSPLYQQMPLSGYSSDYVNGPRMVRQEAIPTLPAGVEARGLQMDPGQAATRVGASLRFAVAIKGSDNKIYNDPRLVNWTISNAQLGQVDRLGTLVPSAAGTVKVVATIGGVSAEATVQVEPAKYAWQQVLSPATVNLHAVKMVSRYEAWAGGDNGTLLHFVNGAWRRDGFMQGGYNVRGLGFASQSNGWAVGSRNGESNPFVLHWNGMTWQNVSIPVGSGQLTSVSVLNDRDAWAAGQDDGGNALILHFDGQKWLQMESPGKGKINDIQMLSPRRGWAVGKQGGLAAAPLIIKFQDGSWSKKNMWDNRGTISLTDSQELTAIKMVSETQGYAVGIRDNPLINPRGIFLSYEPKRDGWVPGSYDSKVEGLDQVPLHDIEMISGTEGWALGEQRQQDYNFQRNPKSIFGNLLANSNGTLRVDTSYFSGNVSGAYYAIDLLPQGEGFVVGEHGSILQRTYDWRGMTNGSYGGSYGGADPYGSGASYGSGQTGQSAVTYGPGGQTIPGGMPTNPY